MITKTLLLAGAALNAAADFGKIVNVVQMKIEHQTKNGETNPLGILELGLFNSDLPKTTENFEWACSNHFTNSIFHRIIPDFMAQGGDFDKGNGTGGRSKWGTEFEDESFSFNHHKYALSMANRGPNSNGSQFFVTFKPASWLDGKHAVFGCAIKGAGTLSKMEALGSPSGKVNGVIKVKSCTVRGASPEEKCLAENHTHSDEM